jgi:predicted PurR-regulated permease PerM
MVDRQDMEGQLQRETPEGSRDQEERRFARKVLIAVLISFAVLLLLLLAGKVFNLVLLVFAGILLALFLRGTGKWVSDRIKTPQPVGQILVIIAAIGLGAIFVWLVSPSVSRQIQELVEELPAAYTSLKDEVHQSQWGRQLLRQLPEPQDLFTSLGGVLRRAGGIFSTTLGVLSSLVIIVFIGLYLAFEPGTYLRGFERLVPKSKRARAREILGAIHATLLDWMVARFIGMAVVGFLTWIGLLLLGIPLALSLGLFAALLTFIPNIGPIVSVIPAALLGLSLGWHKALLVLALYAAIQLVESYVITPLVQRVAVSLPPVVTITFQIVLGILAGILGLIVATPLAAVVLVLVKMVYVHDILGDRSDSPST